MLSINQPILVNHSQCRLAYRTYSPIICTDDRHYGRSTTGDLPKRMTEDRARNDVEPKPGIIRQSCFLPFSEGYTVPTPSEIRVVITKLGMTGSQVAAFCGIASSRTVRKWLAEDADNQNKIPYAVWRKLLLEADLLIFEREKAWLNATRLLVDENWGKDYYTRLADAIENRLKEEWESPPLTLEEFGRLMNMKGGLLHYIKTKIAEREISHAD